MKTAAQIREEQQNLHTGEREAAGIIETIEVHIQQSMSNYIIYPPVSVKATKILNDLGFVITAETLSGWVKISW